MDKLFKDFQEAHAKSKEFVEKYKETVKADVCDTDKLNHLCCFVEDLQYAFRSLNYQLEYLWESLSRHMQGHLPPIKSTEQLERALKALGLDKEYEVEKRTIYASRRGTVFSI